MKKILFSTLFILSFYYLLKAQTFTDINAGLSGVLFSSVAWGDYDNDEDLDILLTGADATFTPISRIYRNDGNDLFTDINAELTDVMLSSVAWGDYDNDGDLDILLNASKNSYGDHVSKIYRNDGNDVFTDIHANLVEVSSGSLAWGDYDNDGDLDIVLTGFTEFKIYRNDGSDTFTDINAELISWGAGSVAWGDYDNDGDLDILFSNFSNSVIYRNDTDDTFTDINAELIELRTSSVAWGDYDNDGDLDILMAGVREDGKGISRIYCNENGVFTDINATLTGVGNEWCTVVWGDYDNDGDLDIFLSGKNNSYFLISRIYRNDGDNVFTEIDAGLKGTQNNAAAWGDYDNDGDLDILLTGECYPNPIANIYRNDGNVFNTTPESPTGLSSQQNGYNITLSWNKTTDNETPQDGLSYNIRISTIPDSLNMVSPMADLSTGYRKVVQFGNTNLDTCWTIKNLQPNTYFWSVQAIDNAFAGSLFATENSFIITSTGREVLSFDKFFNIYPNPTNGIVNIIFENQNVENLIIEIFDNTGKLIYMKQFENVKAKSIKEIDLSTQPKGIYFIKVYGDNILNVEKVLFQ